jgi:hypothetical protein
MEARVTKIGEAIGERKQRATAATAAVAGHSQKKTADVTPATTAATGQAKKMLGDAGGNGAASLVVSRRGAGGRR